ncbi:MAG: 3-hydroxyacyl-ACP dehydratase FabZ [Alicyclobacillus sp.]|nr:3-hydroxyacyl-ACP dehydratase FabZ [Alicyclobacillus sp.]
MADWSLPLYAEDIRRILPHRYPILLVDRVTALEPGKSARGYKLVSANEPHFLGHFPDYMLMPGVLVLEAMAQLGGIALLTQPELAGKQPMFAGIDHARFRGQIRPGDKLEMETQIDRLRAGMGRGHGSAYVDGKLVAEGDILFALA